MKTVNHETQVQTILFTHYGDNWIRGSERCLLDLLKHLDKTCFKPLLWCNQPIMESEAKALGIEVVCTPFPLLFGWQAPRFDLQSFYNLIKQAEQLIKQHDIKLIHANSAAPCQWLNFVAKKCAVPLLCQLHTLYQLRDRLTLGLYQTDMVVGVSQYVVAPLYKDKKPHQQLKVIANGIDTQRLLSQPEVNLRATGNVRIGDFVIATVGSLIKRKGVDRLINSIAILIKKQIPVHLVVIGNGPELENLNRQIKALNLQRHITLLGECENAHGILRGSADLFVSGAREEAFGLVFAEASLAGLAIVAPNIGGISEVVQQQKNGILITDSTDKHFICTLAETVELLYFSPIRCNAIGKNGQQHILKNFTIEQNCKKFSDLYQQLLTNKTVQVSRSEQLLGAGMQIRSIGIALLNAYRRAHQAVNDNPFSSDAPNNKTISNTGGGLLHEK
ncbi:glycosyltransferase family 1 protein [Psychromonas sp. psych-6C06]|uniref:glycosyltransferase family 4 protein n=1 Tax=Psychromonas sp. psych-6C06 TaxID=2058089 RepID=UPI000C339309|nr:glycosyltransferase family 4 protein [Psychromonas sp. psych-6C06]PKF62469.1 glycosyltransferase family 1 protein [Psychromonas sp. psych-6C06]